jgi:NADH-quinone oxidoreductase subunit C
MHSLGGIARIERLAATLQTALAERATRLPALADELCYEVAPAQLLAVATTLRDDPALRFEMLVDLAGVDYLEYGRSEWKTSTATRSGFSRGAARSDAPPGSGASSQGDAPLGGHRARFAVVYQLLSVTHNERLRLRVYCEDAEDPLVDSVTGVWSSANWFEREAFDLYGILFRGHVDLRRLLTDYGFIGHPFRKDFPLSGNVEVRYDAKQGRVVYEPVSIEPRVLVPKTIRDDHRYDPALTRAPVGSAPNKGA